ncbi:MAG TPA: hypothetical protein VGR82_01505 [Methylomirabilota bacterium]|jgi:ElaB/YqjD/DUF883 family membrane-anchored ribosome-binding protein|nr:hypothetical protein [Methylomirabilota bacterium]
MEERRTEERWGRVSERAQDLADRAREATTDAGERLARMAPVGDWMDQARRFVQERPLQAIALTIGLGFVFGKLLGGRDD